MVYSSGMFSCLGLSLGSSGSHDQGNLALCVHIGVPWIVRYSTLGARASFSHVRVEGTVAEGPPKLVSRPRSLNPKPQSHALGFRA